MSGIRDVYDGVPDGLPKGVHPDDPVFKVSEGVFATAPAYARIHGLSQEWVDSVSRTVSRSPVMRKVKARMERMEP